MRVKETKVLIMVVNVVLVIICLFLSLYSILIIHRTTRETLLIHKKIPTCHIVVAKYKEDVAWFSYMDLSRLYVYDKSGDEHSSFERLENKGREGATFLGHIVEYYDNLPDYLVLLQGNPFPHMDDMINPHNLQQHIDHLLETRPTDIQPLFCGYREEPIHLYSGLLLDHYQQLMFEGPPDMTVRFAPGNQYIIPRSAIHRRPKDFYEKLLFMSIQGDHIDVNMAHFGKKKMIPTEIMGWSLERMFPLLLSNKPIRKQFLNHDNHNIQNNPNHNNNNKTKQ